MKIETEQSLPFFHFWSGAKANALMLTYEEMEQVEDVLTDLYPEGIEETTLNDIFWFEFEWVCESIGLEYDVEKDEVKR